MSEQIHLLIGTHKGGFLLTSDPRRKEWRTSGPFFEGTDVQHLTMDTREEPALYAGVNSPWWGPGVRFSRDLGANWEEPEQGVKFAEGSDMSVNKVWQVTPGLESQPGVLYAGVDPGTMFRTEDGGRTWQEVATLTSHPTRDQWGPGAGGMMVHSIVPYPGQPARIHIGISAAGTFETTDGGQTWHPRNKDVLADFHPDKFPEVGQCVHHLASHPSKPDILYQQNHCGVYRSDDAGQQWTDISEGLPSRFGFPLVIHPQDPDTLYVVPLQGPEFRAPVAGEFAVYRSRDRGANWQKLDNGLPASAYPTVYRQALAADSLDMPGLYLGTSTGELFASLDAGDSWQLVRDFLPPIYSVEAVVA